MTWENRCEISSFFEPFRLVVANLRLFPTGPGLHTLSLPVDQRRCPSGFVKSKDVNCIRAHRHRIFRRSSRVDRHNQKGQRTPESPRTNTLYHGHYVPILGRTFRPECSAESLSTSAVLNPYLHSYRP